MADPGVEQVIVGVDGRQVGYLDRGAADATPVLYLHGQPGSRREQLLIPDDTLERLGVRMISVDRPGYGNTDPLQGDRVARSLDVFTVCDALGVGTFPLIAVSAGGSYAVALAANSGRVERLVLSSAQMPYDDLASIEGLQPGQLDLLPLVAMGRVDLVVEVFDLVREALLADPDGFMAPLMTTLSPSERAWADDPRIREMLAADMAEGVRRSGDGFLDDMLSWPEPFEVNVADVQCPVRAVHGTADDWEPLPNLQRILAQIADTELVLLEGLNHLGPQLHPDLVVGLAISDAR